VSNAEEAGLNYGTVLPNWQMDGDAQQFVVFGVPGEEVR
jgi:hypothetical protein